MTFASEVPDENRLRVKRIRDVSLLKSMLTKTGPVFLTLMFKSKFLLDIFSQLSEVIRFMNWQGQTFGKIRIFLSKEKLLESIARSAVSSGMRYTIYEFGVAHGHLTKRMLSIEKEIGTYVKRYNGYDTFEGLPSQYRNFKPGSFSNSGKFPNIENAKLIWFKGLVEETVDKETFTSEPKIILFDLDLLIPTKHVIQHLIPKLAKFDILYFDEGFDESEFSILEDLIPRMDLEYIGTTGQGIALRFLSMRVKAE
jgi:hypothetical protein